MIDVTQHFPSYTGGKQPRAIRYVLMFAMSPSLTLRGSAQSSRQRFNDIGTESLRCPIGLLFRDDGLVVSLDRARIDEPGQLFPSLSQASTLTVGRRCQKPDEDPIRGIGMKQGQHDANRLAEGCVVGVILSVFIWLLLAAVVTLA